MTWKKSVIGLASLCLMLLSGCATGQRSQAPALTIQACPAVKPCQLKGVSPKTNGDLNLALEQAYADWASCAAQVDMIHRCQNAQAR